MRAQVETRGPWGVIVRVRGVLCSDGKRRTAYNVREPDTFFSAPAPATVGGATVTGYITPAEDEDIEFRAYRYGKNGHLLP
jgi:hypothetical protein